MFLIDTNIISEIVAKYPNKNVLDFLEKNRNFLYLSVVTIGEIKAGIEKLENSKRKIYLLHWLEELKINFNDKILNIDIEVMLKWGEIISILQKKGISISIMDGLIASSAIRYKMILVTRNEKDFKNIDDLKIINPFKEDYEMEIN